MQAMHQQLHVRPPYFSGTLAIRSAKPLRHSKECLTKVPAKSLAFWSQSVEPTTVGCLPVHSNFSTEISICFKTVGSVCTPEQWIPWRSSIFICTCCACSIACSVANHWILDCDKFISISHKQWRQAQLLRQHSVRELKSSAEGRRFELIASNKEFKAPSQADPTTQLATIAP